MPMFYDLFEDLDKHLKDLEKHFEDTKKEVEFASRLGYQTPMSLQEKSIQRQIDMKKKMLHEVQQRQTRPPIPPGLSSGVQSIVNMPSSNNYDIIKKASESKTNNQYVNHRDYEEDYVFEPYTDRPYIAWCRVCELIIDKKEKCCPSCSDPNSILVYRQKKDNIELKKEKKLKAEAEALELKMKSLPKCGDPNCIGGCSVVDCFPVDDNKKKVIYLDVSKKNNNYESNSTEGKILQKFNKDIHKINVSEYRTTSTLVFLIMTIVGCGIYTFFPLFGAFWLSGSLASYVTKMFNGPKE